MNATPASEQVKALAASLPKLMEIPLVFYSTENGLKVSRKAEGQPIETKVSVSIAGIHHRFETLTYVEEFRLVPIEGEDSVGDVIFEITTAAGCKIEIPASESHDNHTTYSIQDFISAFSVRSSKIINLFTPKIAGFIAIGWEIESIKRRAYDLSTVTNQINEAVQMVTKSEAELKRREEVLTKKASDLEAEHQKNEADLKERNLKVAEKEKSSLAKLEATKKSVEELNTQKANLESEVTDLEKGVASSNGDLKVLQDRLDSASKSLAEAENRSTLLTSEIKSKSDESATLSSKLRKLQSDTTNYAEDMEGLGKEVRTQSIVYAAIILVAALGIGYLGLHVASMSDQISSEYLKNQNLHVWSLIGLRASFMTIVGSALGFLVYLTKFSIGQVAEMFAHRRAMVTIGIFAREYTLSAAQGLMVSDAEIFSARMEVRKALIVDQMSGRFRQTLSGLPKVDESDHARSQDNTAK